jgi:hypothetical protein
MIYEVNTDELLFELFCYAIYAPQDLTEIRQKYDALSNKGRSQVKAAYETIGRLLNQCTVCGAGLDPHGFCIRCEPEAF